MPWVETLLGNAIVVTLAAPVVWLLCRFVKRPVLAHALWALLLLKLVTPAIVRIDLLPAAAPGNSSSLEAHEPRSSSRPPEVAIDPGSLLLEAEPGLEPIEAMVGGGPIPGSSLPRQPSAAAPVVDDAGGQSNWAWLLVVWAAGALSLFVCAVWRIAAFSRYLRRSTVEDAGVRAAVERLAGAFGLRRAPRVRIVSGRVSPMLWAGIGKATVVLPQPLLAEMDEAERDSLLAHEIAHFARRDHWVRWLELGATALFWWHPVLWWVRHELRDVEEACCDAWAVTVLRAKRPYADALLDVLDFLSTARPGLPVGASGMGQVRSLQRRLTMIMTNDARPHLSRVGRLTLFAAASLLFPVIPALAQQERAAEATSTEQVEEVAVASQGQGRRSRDRIVRLERRLAGLAARADEKRSKGEHVEARQIRAEIAALRNRLAKMRGSEAEAEVEEIEEAAEAEEIEEVVEEREIAELRERELSNQKAQQRARWRERIASQQQKVNSAKQRIDELRARYEQLARTGKHAAASEMAKLIDRMQAEQKRNRNAQERAFRNYMEQAGRRAPGASNWRSAMRGLERSITILSKRGNGEIAELLRDVARKLRADKEHGQNQITEYADRVRAVERVSVEAGQQGSNRRIDQLEEKLDRINSMMESLRRELRNARRNNTRRSSGR